MAKKATDRTAIREIAAPFVEARTAGELSEASARLRRSIRRGEVAVDDAKEAIQLLSPGHNRTMAEHALTDPTVVVTPKSDAERLSRHRARIIEGTRGVSERTLLLYILEVLVDILEKK